MEQKSLSLMLQVRNFLLLKSSVRKYLIRTKIKGNTHYKREFSYDSKKNRNVVQLDRAAMSKIIDQTPFEKNSVLHSLAERTACLELVTKNYGGKTHPPNSMVRFVLSNPVYDKERVLIYS